MREALGRLAVGSHVLVAVIWAVGRLLLVVGLGKLSSLTSESGLLVRTCLPRFGWWPLAAMVGLPSVVFLLAAGFAWWGALHIPRGTRGRLRRLVLAGAWAVHLMSLVAAFGLALWGIGVGRWTDAGMVWRFDFSWPLVLADRTLTVVHWASYVGVVVGLLGSWFLIPFRIRRVFWFAVDALLVGAAAWAVWYLPIKPQSNDPAQLLAPLARLGITFVFCVRASVRLVGPLLDLIGRIGFLTTTASRHLRARKSGFLAAIGTLAVLAVSFSSCSLTTTLSVMGGFRNDLKKKILGNHAHVAVDRPSGSIEGWAPLLAKLEHVDGVRAASPYLAAEVMASSASNMSGAVLRGVDVMRAAETTDLKRNMVEGELRFLTDPGALLEASRNGSDRKRLPLIPSFGRESERQPQSSETDSEVADLANQNLPGVILGQELARMLRVVTGDEINLVAPLGDLGPSGPMPKARPFRVVGVFYSGMYEYDMKYAYVTLDSAQRFLGVGDVVGGFEIKVERVDEAPIVASSIRSALRKRDNLRVRDWQEANRNLFGALALEKLAMFITLGVAILVAGFCVFGTLMLMVQEKSREVAILKAMGATARSIVGVFLVEGLLIGIFGACAGLGLGFLVAFGAENIGFRMRPEVYYIDRLPVHIDPVEFSLVGAAAVVVCLAATAFPAFQASRGQVVDALRYD